MEIVKSNVYNTNLKEAGRGVYNFFNEYAADYFDEITFNENYGTLLCKKDEVELLKIGGFNNFSIIVKTQNNSNTPKVSLFPTGAVPYEVQACSGGIVMNLISNNVVYGFCLAVTKDNAGNTAVILQDSPVPSAADPVKVYAITPDTVSDAYTYIYRSTAEADGNKAPLTLLCPFAVHTADGNYTPDALLAVYHEYTEKGNLYVDGVKYLYNGIWCVRAE